MSAGWNEVGLEIREGPGGRSAQQRLPVLEINRDKFQLFDVTLELCIKQHVLNHNIKQRGMNKVLYL